ncbi:MAG TPA: hypothetical protein VG537_05910 [Candidatus Kapabacteria bacterium]|jgi:hypothetical protein|nr:hypothetical protein [Candidatus Kapabacteria bacterium]
MKPLIVVFSIIISPYFALAQSMHVTTLQHGRDSLSLRQGATITFSTSPSPLPNLTCSMKQGPGSSFVNGFDINDFVSQLSDCNGLPDMLPIDSIGISNTGKGDVTAPYVITFTLIRMSFLAVVGGSAGYSETGSVVATGTIAGPSVAAGKTSAPVSFSNSGGTWSFAPGSPFAIAPTMACGAGIVGSPVLECGLYKLKIKIDATDQIVESDESDNECDSYIYAPGSPITDFKFSWDLTAAAKTDTANANAAAKADGYPGGEAPPGWCPSFAPAPLPAPSASPWVVVTITPVPGTLPTGVSFNVNGSAMPCFQNTCDIPSIAGLPVKGATAATKVNCSVGGVDCSLAIFPCPDCVQSCVTWRVTAISNDGCRIKSDEFSQDIFHRCH